MKTQNWLMVLLLILAVAVVGLYQLDSWHSDRHDLNAKIAVENNKKNISIIDSARYYVNRTSISTLNRDKILNLLEGYYVIRTQAQKDSIILAEIKQDSIDRAKFAIDFDGMFAISVNADNELYTVGSLTMSDTQKPIVMTPELEDPYFKFLGSQSVEFETNNLFNELEWTAAFFIRQDSREGKRVVFENGINIIYLDNLESSPTNIKLEKDVWSFIVISSNGNLINIYKDGVLSVTTTDSPLSNDNNSILRVGLSVAGDDYLIADVKRFMYWNTAKSQTEASNIFKNRFYYKI